ncbi:FAD-dependent pyridine nucleotide-disulfide oxidoreductase domain protein, partial [mine drainage metagenome]
MTRLLIVGGSDAGISAGLRARELAPDVEATLVVADAYPNYSICGIPYHLSGEVPDWHSLAHRSRADLEAAGLELLLCHTARHIDPAARKVTVTDPNGTEQALAYDTLVVATGATPFRPPITGLDRLRAAEGVHLLHTMDDTFAVADTLARRPAGRALIVGAGYIGMEMADALTSGAWRSPWSKPCPRCSPPSTPTSPPSVEAALAGQGVEVVTNTTVTEIRHTAHGLQVAGANGFARSAELV